MILLLQSRLGAIGAIGETAIREAFSGDLRQLQDLLVGKIKAALELSGDDDWWPYIRALFDDFIIVENKDGKLMKYAYSVDGTDVTLSNPVEVVLDYQEVREALAEDSTEVRPQGQFLEADKSNEGSIYRIRVIQAGLSGNKCFYPDAVLREGVDLFNGVRVFVKSDTEHLKGDGKDVRNIIGSLSNAAFVEGKGVDDGSIEADFNVLEPEGDIGTKLKEAWNRGMTGLFGFSMDTIGAVCMKRTGGQVFREAKSFTKVKSVDLIVEPGAGGQIVNLIEAQSDNLKDNEMWRDRLIEALVQAGVFKEAKEAENLTDNELQGRMTEALNTGDKNNDGLVDLNAQIREAVALEATMREAVNVSKLPAIAKQKLVTRFTEAKSFTSGDVTQAIKDELEYIGQFTEGSAVSGMGGGRNEVGESNLNAVNMLEAFYDKSHKDHRHAQSFKTIYAEITGDQKVTGRMQNCNQNVMREAFSGADDLGVFIEAIDSTTFANVVGAVMQRAMLADYNTDGIYDIWKHLPTIVSASDFRTKESSRIGGYGDLPIVAEGADYTALTTPGDEKASYAIAKRGGTEELTIEAIKNDDVGYIRRMPMKLSRAAKRTLSKFVLDFLRTNPVIYDGVTLFHATHNNLGTAALDKTSLAARRLAMKKQTELGSGERLGIGPRNMWVPDDLEEGAVDLFRRNTENDKNFIQSLAPNIIPVWDWTDANDWCLTADKDDVPFMELAFLDGNEEPELWIQDDPRGGSLFTADKITYKQRHIYGGNITDFRGAQKSVVA